MIYLVTGAAGFIGSNLVEALVKQGESVRAVDNFSTGKKENLAPFLDVIDFIEGDVRDEALCRNLCEGADVVLHQAALGSVPRSIDDPLNTDANNATGTLNMMVAAKDAEVGRFVYASSSSVYGDTVELPKHEAMPLSPRSPYAVTKAMAEMYGKVFFDVYGLHTVGLRYFNVFGPRQDAASGYAAVIPKFVKALLEGDAPVIFGDGEQTRDFTYIDNVVQANLKAAVAPASACGQAYNVGCGERISVNALFAQIAQGLGLSVEAQYQDPRPGDVRDSLASIEKIQKNLDYKPEVMSAEGIARSIDWYRDALV